MTSEVPLGSWTATDPASVGMSEKALDNLAHHMQGTGCIVRSGKLVYSWGNIERPIDIYSACKPVITHFLFLALEQGRISNLDRYASDYEPQLLEINAAHGYKDRAITFRHLGNQLSCYGVEEAPGAAFDYNDWQIALLIDILFLGIYNVPYDSWDHEILEPFLTGPLGCEDRPTLLAYGPSHRQGRMAISVRDFARFGLLYLNEGNWGGRELLAPHLARRAISEPVANSVPRAGMRAAEMIAGQRSLGSEAIPDNQSDHFGSYSWCWWINGVDAAGRRYWPASTPDTFCALGDENGRRGIGVVPSRELVISWNETVLDSYPEVPHPLNECFDQLLSACEN